MTTIFGRNKLTEILHHLMMRLVGQCWMWWSSSDEQKAPKWTHTMDWSLIQRVTEEHIRQSWWSCINISAHLYLISSHTSKTFTLHNSGWFCRTKGMDFAGVWIRTKDMELNQLAVVMFHVLFPDDKNLPIELMALLNWWVKSWKILAVNLKQADLKTKRIN